MSVRIPTPAVACVLALALPLQAPAQEPLPLLVSVEWLASHQNDPGLVLLHVGDDRSKEAYDAGHIPGSVFVHPWRELAAPVEEGGLRLELPSEDLLVSTLRAKGISNDSRIVIVQARQYISPATRTLLTLSWAGFTGRIALLDGGVEAWQAAGHPVTTEVPTPVPGRYTAAIDPSVVVDAEYVAANRERAEVALLDSRTRDFYDGRETGQGRNGHIPGAASVPFNSLVEENGLFKPADTLRQILVDAGAESGARVVTYCHIGQQATVVWFAARLLGYAASVYDGSFQEWARRTDQPVVSPAPGGGP